MPRPEHSRPRPSRPRPSRPRPLRRGLAFALALALSFAVSGPAAAEPVNHVVLRVNNRIATHFEYQHKLAQRRQLIERSENVDAAARQKAWQEAPKAVLYEIFEDLLLQSRADLLRIRVSREELDGMVANIREANKLATDEELRRAVEQSGMSWDQFLTQLGDQARYRELIGREVQGRIKLEEDDLRILYRDQPEQFRLPEERKLREIVVLDSSPLSPEARQELAEEIRARIDQGEDPAAVAAETSADGRTGGLVDLDWIAKGDLDAALEQAVAEIPAGKAAPPVAGRGGLHVIQVVERKNERLRPFEDVKDEIAEREHARLYRREYPKYLQELEQASYIVENIPPDAVGYRKAEALDDPADPLDIFKQKPGASEPGPGPAPQAPSSPPSG